MEKSNCLMLMTTLYTGIDLDAVFDEGDLRDEGIEFDTHVTVFYDKGEKEFGDFKEDLGEILGPPEAKTFLEFLKGDHQYPILDVFNISSFDSGVIILKLKTDSIIYKYLEKINKGLTEKYGLKSDFSTYTPHLTLAFVNPNSIEKYTNDQGLRGILSKGFVRFDDLLMSYGTVDDNDYTHIAVTNYHTLERHFRLDEYRR